MNFRCAQWRAIDGRGAASEAKVFGGEQSLLPLMRLRLAPPTALVDIQDVGDLRFVARLRDPALSEQLCGVLHDPLPAGPPAPGSRLIRHVPMLAAYCTERSRMCRGEEPARAGTPWRPAGAWPRLRSSPCRALHRRNHPPIVRRLAPPARRMSEKTSRVDGRAMRERIRGKTQCQSAPLPFCRAAGVGAEPADAAAAVLAHRDRPGGGSPGCDRGRAGLGERELVVACGDVADPVSVTVGSFGVSQELGG